MSEIEKAIQEIEDMSYHPSSKQDITAVSMCVILKALQEKAEREKGCEYCCYQEYPDTTMCPKDDYIFYAGYYNQADVDKFDEFETDKISYCPMCGRKLVEE